MKKILFCFKMPLNTYFGGIASIVKNYIDNRDIFLEHGVDVELFNYQNEKIQAIKNSKIQNLVYAIKQRKALSKFLRKDAGEHIIHIHTSIKWLFFKDCLLAKYIKKHFTNKVVMTIHFSDLDKIMYNKPLLKRIEKNILVNYVDKTIVLSQKMENELLGLGLSKKNVSLLYTFHSFDTNDFLLPKGSNECKNLLFMGSFDKRKGILDLLNVVNTIPDYNFVLHLCGKLTDESIKADFNFLISKLENKVIQHGYITGGQKKEIFHQADIFILPSYAEGMPIVIMEAMAAGCAVISTKIAAIPEIVSDENGILINPGNLLELKNAVITMLEPTYDINRIKLNNMKKSKLFSVSEHIKELCNIYDSLYKD